MKRVIFTTFDNIDTPNDRESNENIFTQGPKGDQPKKELVIEYFDRLIQNKKDYAESIGVEFKFFHNTMKDFMLEDELEFTRVNLYKHHLMAELAKEYDEILYVDMDVLFNTSLNIFEEHDMSAGIYVKGTEIKADLKEKRGLLFSQVGLRSPELKYHITKELLSGKDNYVMNTGIVLSRAEFIHQLKFIERTRIAAEKIEKIKSNFDDENFTVLNLDFYPNNESIFSWILEEWQIPYVLFSDKWHMMYNDVPSKFNKEVKDPYCMHFINKQFNAFFNEKTKCIFSMHVHISDDNLDSPRGPSGLKKNKSKIAQEQFVKYKDQLKSNHESYAKEIGATYLHFGRDADYEKFKNRFTDLSEYDIINLYKIYLLDRLVKEYDLVMYADMDVYFNQTYDIFNYLPCTKAIACLNHSATYLSIDAKNKKYMDEYKHDFRSPHAKYWNAHALLTENGHSGDNVVFNTGIVIANRESMKKLDYFSDIEETIQTMKELKNDEFSMYPKNIQSSFGYDNETIFAYKIFANQVDFVNLNNTWHFQHHHNSTVTNDVFDPNSQEFKRAKSVYQRFAENYNVVITHFISKNFGLVFDK